MANSAFWVGLMLAMPDKCRGNWAKYFNYRDVRHNFLKAAQHGLSNEFVWFGKSRAASELILEDLIPMAAKGLANAGIPKKEFKDYLKTIERRVLAKQTGSDWIIRAMRKLNNKCSVDESMLLVTHYMNEYAREGVPIHEWKLPKRSTLKKIPNRYQRVDSVMTSNVIMARDDDLLDYGKALMEWYGLNRIPIENSKGQIRGVLTRKDIGNFEPSGEEPPLIRDCMTTDVLTIAPEHSLETAEKTMLAHEIGSLPVVRDDRVIGIITADDIRTVQKKLRKDVGA